MPQRRPQEGHDSHRQRRRRRRSVELSPGDSLAPKYHGPSPPPPEQASTPRSERDHCRSNATARIPAASLLAAHTAEEKHHHHHRNAARRRADRTIRLRGPPPRRPRSRRPKPSQAAGHRPPRKRDERSSFPPLDDPVQLLVQLPSTTPTAMVLSRQIGAATCRARSGRTRPAHPWAATREQPHRRERPCRGAPRPIGTRGRQPRSQRRTDRTWEEEGARDPLLMEPTPPSRASAATSRLHHGQAPPRHRETAGAAPP